MDAPSWMRRETRPRAIGRRLPYTCKSGYRNRRSSRGDPIVSSKTELDIENLHCIDFEYTPTLHPGTPEHTYKISHQNSIPDALPAGSALRFGHFQKEYQCTLRTTPANIFTVIKLPTKVGSKRIYTYIIVDIK